METQEYPLYAPGDILNVPDIRPQDMILFMVLFGMMRLEGYCWATNEYLCNRLRWSERTLQRSLKILQNLELIRIETDGLQRRIYPVKVDATPVRTDAPPPSNLSPDSISSSKNKIRRINKETHDAILEAYKKYPIKKGKTVGVKRLASQIVSVDDLRDLNTAIENYAIECKGKDEQYIKHFSTFASCWRDYLEAPPPAKSEWVAMKVIDGKLVPVPQE